MNADLSLYHMLTGASPVVQLVMLLLLLASVISWSMIIRKSRDMKKAMRAADEFEARFWSGKKLSELYEQMGSGRRSSIGMAAIFEAGFREYVRLRQKSNSDPQFVLAGAQRSMRVALMREMDVVEANLSFLATVGSTSPYVGLFGTVWGIMNSFRALGNVQQATLASVAPGIAEALIATAMGLFAAIPAVIAYNRYSHGVERLENRYETFMEEFSTILQRQAHD
ncbi:protein TolQ [Sulfuriflexus sp.]|uniref:protein TolQ n=1 Tax=Sulfuriflexus sp. TaxID=2015443 RepID=UPI0028CFBFB5|nr:protein TolQ [Sulfuriflexus sp.]MDT8404259.1 protein TolQ [Sulfuriflexus sp.]